MSLYNYVNFIVACDNKGGIGKNNKLPWHISEDLKYFKKLTNKNTVIMGSKTYFSIPKNHRPLSNRLNLVLTNNKDLLKNNHNNSNLKFFNFNNNYNIYDIENYDQIYKLNKISLLVRNTKEFMNSQIFIIGGEQIYNIFFNLLKNDFHKELQFNNIYLTYIEKNYNCDTFFPKLIQNFKLNDYSPKKYDDKEKVYYRFLSYNKEFFNNDIDSEKIYHDIAQNILDNGNYRIDRTNTGIYSIFGTQMRFNITNSIPILTTKRVPFKTCIHELLWFLNGNTNNKDLQKNNVHIWDGNSSREFLDKVGLDNLDEGDCGACYGFQWRHFGATYIDSYIEDQDLRITPYLTESFQGVWKVEKKWKVSNLTLDITGTTTGPLKLPTLGPLDPRPNYSSTFHILNFQLTKSWNNAFETYSGIKNLLDFTPSVESIARSFDPFDKAVTFNVQGDALSTQNNPFALTFDPSYVYASNQGIRFFFGLRWKLD